ncbi:MAG TPA: Holliday junction resolvase RuvX, partial [Solirubrobacteraceae bacterium]|nr:Holliday junction resolvase RuvX [Solirubrobacteraceae bacterium]
LDGSDSDQTHEARAFAAKLQEQLGNGTPVQLYDERFTTKLAQRAAGRSHASEDSRAAAHLLDSWLSAQSG